MLSTGFGNQSMGFEKDWLDPAGDVGGTLDGGEEVRQAGDDANVGLVPLRQQGLLEDSEISTGNELSGLDRSTGSLTGLVEVTTNVRVTNDRKNVRHCRKNQSPPSRKCKNMKY